MDQNNPVIQKGLRLCFIFLLTAAGLGEWKTLNNMLGGLPKAITAGIICMTIAYAIIFPDLKRFKQLKGPTLFYMSLITALLLWSMVIWILNFMNLSSMIRGCSKVIFQSIAILTALSGVYLFGAEAVDLFAVAMCLANGAIMVLEIPSFGIAASIQSLITCLVTFGDAEGYARNLEIHDLTFVFGQLVLYYVVFAPKDTRRERKKALADDLTVYLFLSGRNEADRHSGSRSFRCAFVFLKNKKFLKPFLILQGLLLGCVLFPVCLRGSDGRSVKDYEYGRNRHDGA